MNKARLLETLSCVDCSERDPIVLEFDHRDSGLKVASVSRMMATHGWSTVLTEIAKCDVRCVNSHRRRTARQFGRTKQIQEDASFRMLLNAGVAQLVERNFPKVEVRGFETRLPLRGATDADP